MDERMTRVRMNIREGLIELEGSEEFVQKNLDEFKGLIQNINQDKKLSPGTASPANFLKKATEKNFPKTRILPKIVEPVPFDTKTNGKDKPSLREFFNSKGMPVLHKEIIICIAVYLKKYLGIAEFTEGQISYGYLDLKIKRPEAFHQAFIDTKNATKWITPGEGAFSWKVFPIGEDYVERDLPKSKDEKKRAN